MAIPLEQFVKHLEDSGVIASETLRDFVPPKASPKDAEELARELVRQKKLTKFQAELIWIGQGKSLVLGNYLLLDKIGAGGMGQVFKAEHRRMHRTVALKVLPPSMMRDASAVARFEREVTAAAKLNHPNIVTAYDADHANGVHFLVMECVEGQDLSALVKKNGPFSVSQTVHYILQAARGLEFAHKKGVVHRDIKPSNLLVDKEGTVKVLDMGLARIEQGDGPAQSELTGSGAVMGTVDFMAPEQAVSSHHADARADIYSLGCSLYFLLTGKAIYDGESLMAKLLAHRDQPIPAIGTIRPEVPESVESVFRKMVAKRIEDRYQSMTEVIADLQRCGFEQTVNPPTFEASDNGLTSFLKDVAESAATPDVLKQESDSRTGRKNKRWLLVGGSAVLLLAAIVFFAPQKESLLRVEIDDPQITVAIKGTDFVFKGADQSRDVRLSPGDYTLVVHYGDFTFETNALVLNPGETSTVQVEVLAGKVDVRHRKKLLGQSKLPWHGWPVDAPPAAIAPFTAKQAKKHQADWAKYLHLELEYTNSIGMKFVLIPPGEFTMGSTSKEIEAALPDEAKHWQEGVKSEAPQHKVILTQPIYLGVNEVTQVEYEKVMGVNPSWFAPLGMGKEAVAGLETAEHPVEMVSWNDAVEFCVKLSKQEKLKPFYFLAGGTVTPLEGTGYRLPTEAEWEYACRAGTTRKYWSGDQDEDLVRAGWFGTNSGGRTHAAGELKANPFGLYDVHGNVFEWVQDWWEAEYYWQFSGKSAISPSGPSSAGFRRVIRGGGWNEPASHSRSSARYSYDPPNGDLLIGFRVALVAVGSRVGH